MKDPVFANGIIFPNQGGSRLWKPHGLLTHLSLVHCLKFLLFLLMLWPPQPQSLSLLP